jgi:thiosulfate dehydrogenase [quinone] large subunit
VANTLRRTGRPWETIITPLLKSWRTAPNYAFRLILVNQFSTILSEKHDVVNQGSGHSDARGKAMDQFTIDKRLVLTFRLLMGWVFLYAGLWQVLSSDFSTSQFLAHTKTFHTLYAPLTAPAIAPVLTFLVSWGHLLIGLSLVSGLLVRVSGCFGIALFLTYWTAHMDFPYIESHVNLIIDYHIVYTVITASLVAANAGHAYGLDGWLARRRGTPAVVAVGSAA